MRVTLLGSILALCWMSTMVAAQNLVVNGDFETDTYTVWPGYSGGDNPENITGWTGVGNNGINPVFEPLNPASILGWTRNEDSSGNIGINPIADGRAPFADNGDVDGGVMFVQGTASVFQEVTGLTVGEDYLLRVEYNARNCCGDVPAVSLELNGELSDQFPDPDVFDADDIFPVDTGAWWLSEIPITADEETLTVEFFTEPLGGGDATFVLDNISLELANGGDNLIVNGDFEDNLDAFQLFPGYLSAAEVGLEPPFRDNGNNETQVALLQVTSSIEQEITGLTPGTEYTISLDYNARNCCGAFPDPSLLIDDEPIEDFDDEVEIVFPVEGDNDWYNYQTTYVAESDSAVLKIQTMSEDEIGDSTFLVDNVFFGIPGVGCDPNSQGDLDGNGKIEFADFLVLSGNFGKEVDDHTFGDIDCNGKVEFADFLSLSGNFGKTLGEVQSVPEPASMGSLLIGILCWGFRRKRRMSA